MVLRDNMVEIRPKSHLREGRRAYVTKRKTWESARGAEGDVCLRGVVCAAHDRRSSLTSSVSRRSFFRSNARICRLCARRILSVGTVRTTAKTTAEITLQTGPVRNTRDGMGECQRAPITGGGGSAKGRGGGGHVNLLERFMHACQAGPFRCVGIYLLFLGNLTSSRGRSSTTRFRSDCRCVELATASSTCRCLPPRAPFNKSRQQQPPGESIDGRLTSLTLGPQYLVNLVPNSTTTPPQPSRANTIMTKNSPR